MILAGRSDPVIVWPAAILSHPTVTPIFIVAPGSFAYACRRRNVHFWPRAGRHERLLTGNQKIAVGLP